MAVVTATVIAMVSTAVVEGLALVVGASVVVIASTVVVVAVVVAAATTAVASVVVAIAIVVVELAAAISACALPVEVGTAATVVVTAAVVAIATIAAVVAELLLVLGGATVLIAAVVVTTAHASAMTVASAPTTAAAITPNLLAVGWDHGRLVVVSTTHLAMVMTTTATHRPSTIVAAMVVETATTTARREGRAAAAPSPVAAAIATLVIALILGLRLFDIDSTAVDLRHRVVLDQVLRHRLVREGHEAEAAGRTRVDVLEDDCVVHLSELHEVLLELLASQLEVEPAHEDLALGVGELDTVLRVVTATDSVLLHDLDVWVGLLDVLAVVSHHEVVVLVVATLATAAMTPTMLVLVAATAHIAAAVASATLMVICRFDIDAFLEDPVALRLVLPYDRALDLLRFALVFEAQQHEAEATAALRDFLPHDDGVLHLAELLEVALQVLLGGREGQPADKQLDLVFLGRLMEGGRGTVATPSIAGLGAAKVATATSSVHATVREAVLERRYLEGHHLG